MTGSTKARPFNASHWVSQPLRRLRRDGSHWLPPSRHLASGVVAAIVVGIAIALVVVPIAGRGDYGQWLMTSRYYLGESVPDYRVVSNLPPAIPLVLAGIRALVPDPVAALALLVVILAGALALAFYLAGRSVWNSRLAGLTSVGAAFLLTDRYLELFAFGGLFQVAAVALMCAAVAFFVRAGRRPFQLRWWVAGLAAVMVIAFVHLGTALVAIPAALAVAGVVGVRLVIAGIDVRQPVALTGVVLTALALMWVVLLEPNSEVYLTNPASLAYRGPDRLIASLFGYGPTAAVAILGLAAVAGGVAHSVIRRRINGAVLLAVWVAVVWGALAASALAGAATDYPRFAPVLVAPLVVGAGGGLIAILRTAANTLRRYVPPRSTIVSLQLLVVLTVVIASPIAIGRFNRQASTYQPQDAQALTAVTKWLDETLPAGATIAANVRESKWIEGVTGRTTLFSQPTRYAFRPIEWQRSVDANALLRATGGMTNGLWSATYTSRSGNRTAVLTDLLLSVNHGGEVVDILREESAGTGIVGARNGVTPMTTPVNSVSAERARVATITNRFSADGGAAGPIEFVQSARMWADSTTMSVTAASAATAVQLEYSLVHGIVLDSSTGGTRDKQLCFTAVGGSRPCIRIYSPVPDARIEVSSAGSVRASTATSSRLELYLTAQTAGRPAVELTLLNPESIVARHAVGGVLLLADDPASTSRQKRLEQLGFVGGPRFGPYLPMIRTTPEFAAP